jgi:hypothetical protein
MTTTVTLKRVSTLEKTNKSLPAVPYRSISSSTYLTDDLRFFVYKDDGGSWRWEAVFDKWTADCNNLTRWGHTKENAVRALETFLKEEEYEASLWKN